MSSATYQLDDLQGSKDEPCLLLSCPTIQIAVKLFQHTMDFLGDIDVESLVFVLVEQEISDQMVNCCVHKILKLFHCISQGCWSRSAATLFDQIQFFLHPFQL